MMDWISGAFEWAVVAYFVCVGALLPIGLLGGVVYLARVVWGIDP